MRPRGTPSRPRTTGRSKRSKDGGLKFDATAVTYRYLDDDEVAKLRKEKAKEKAGK